MKTNLSIIAAIFGNSSQMSMPGTLVLDRLEVAADLARGVRLEVPHVDDAAARRAGKY